ncbi:hypothetical protein IH970_08375 [candidate division KSB1 bacterium]|nr:hypothetical protein [candidate division KSB1 bacterium]
MWLKDHPPDYQNYQNLGFSVATGELYYQTVWRTKTTTIYLELSGKNFDFHLSIDYNSKRLIDDFFKMLDKRENAQL